MMDKRLSPVHPLEQADEEGMLGLPVRGSRDLLEPAGIPIFNLTFTQYFYKRWLLSV